MAATGQSTALADGGEIAVNVLLRFLHFNGRQSLNHKRLVSLNRRLCDRRRAGARSGKAAGHDDQSRRLVSSIRALLVALSKTRIATGATKPAQPKGGAGLDVA